MPVLGCSSLEESYPSLANQSSSGAIQGNVKLVSERPYCLKRLAFYFFADLCPVASTPSICLEVSLPLGRIVVHSKFDMRHEFYLVVVIRKEEEKL